MKSLKYIFVLSAAGALCACADMLETETKSSFDTETVFSNYELAESCNFGITQALLEKANHRGRFHPYVGLNSDIEWGNNWSNETNQPNNANRQAVFGYNLLPTNGEMNTSGSSADAYSPYYTAIERANLNIKNLRKYGNIENDADMAYLLGEALTLRAVMYYDLLRAWGDVPFRTEPISNDIYIPKTDRDVIFKQILGDLEEAWDYLPWPGKGHATTTDRANRAFAKGLYARLALMASGYALRPEAGAVGTGDAGSVRLSSDPELAQEVLYPKALAACVDVIRNSGCSLYTSFEQLWRDMNNFDISAAGTGREVLWIFPYGNNRGRWNYTFAVRHDGADKYIGTGKDRGGSVGPVPTLWFDYGAKDTRRDVSCVNYKWNDGTLELAGIDTWYFGKFRFEWMENNPYGGGNDDGFKPPYMRLSDVYLMAAECAIHSSCTGADGGGVNNAKNYLLEVRKRAYAGNEQEAVNYVNSLSTDGMFDAIVEERALEFVGEMLRKTDLIRWNLLKAKMDETKAKLHDLNDWTGDFSYLSQGGGYVYYKISGTTLKTYGLQPDEQAAPDATWTPYVNSEGKISKYLPQASGTDSPKFSDAEINRLYDKDPNTRQYWPIFQSVIDNSQGQIHNDYGY